MAHLQHLDELVREYLLFRGFTITLKSFDAELKVDKDRGFRVDRIVDQFVLFINNYDLHSLRDLWTHFDLKIFTKLDHEYMPGVRKLESSLLKFYLINAVSNGKSDKVIEFFTKMTSEIQGQPEWKDWFMLPYVKNPEEHTVFSVHFTKQWQDAFLVSLHNFLAIIYQVMPQPVLSSYEEEATRQKRLQEENDALKHKLASLGQGLSVVPDAVPPIEIMDDFYIIAPETPSSNENHGKSLKSFIRTMGGGLPTSPVMGRRPQTQDEQIGIHKHHSGKRNPASQSWIKYSGVDSVPKRSLSLDSRSRRVQRDVSLENVDRRSSKKDHFLLLSQEQLSEHKASVTQCRFNSGGSLVASCDMDGVLKVWSPSPTPSVISSSHFKRGLTALSWVGKNERFFITGSVDGVLRLHDTKEHKVVWDVRPDESSPLYNSKILSICCSHSERLLACTAIDFNGSNSKLLLFDIKTQKFEHTIGLGEGGPNLRANCCLFNHNGSLLIVGCSDGSVRIVDVRNGDCLEKSSSHEGPVTAVHIAQDHNTYYTFGDDHKLCRHNLSHHSGESTWSAVLPSTCRSSHGTQGFSLHHSGQHILTACGEAGAIIYQVNQGGLQMMLNLKGHRTPLTACDWSMANQCVTCISSSTDGIIKISTILTP